MSVIHKFTLIQLAALIILWIVKVSPAGIFFPLFIALLVPLRFYLGKHFKKEHLDFLDSEEEAADAEIADSEAGEEGEGAEGGDAPAEGGEDAKEEGGE